MSDSNKKGDFASPNSDESCTSTDNGKDDFSQSDILSELYSGLDDSIEKGSDATINTDVFSDSRVIFEDLVVKSKSKYKTRAEVMNIINVITHWDTGTVDLPGVTEFRKAHKKGYYWVSHFQVLSKKLENRTIKELHVRKSSSGTRIVPIEEIFDIILKCHVDGAVHQKVRRTYNYIKKTYFNISEKMVDIFIITDKNSVKYYFELMDSLRMNNKLQQTVQDKQALKMKIYRGETITVKIGDIVNIRIPFVDKAPCKTLDIIGVVFKMRERTKTVAVITEHGILAYGGKGQSNKKILYLSPGSDYEVISRTAESETSTECTS